MASSRVAGADTEGRMRKPTTRDIVFSGLVVASLAIGVEGATLLPVEGWIAAIVAGILTVTAFVVMAGLIIFGTYARGGGHYA